MTTPSPGTDPGMPIEPVSNWENQSVGGAALSARCVYDEKQATIAALRARQELYLESLPTDPAQAIREALDLMQPCGESYPEGFADALHTACFLRSLVRDLTEDSPGPQTDAALHIADRMWDWLNTAANRLDRASDLLGHAHRAGRT